MFSDDSTNIINLYTKLKDKFLFKFTVEVSYQRKILYLAIKMMNYEQLFYENNHSLEFQIFKTYSKKNHANYFVKLFNLF